ncbi:MAG: bacteriochlorophyll 4-vinyl reductase [Tabrizicola sp.]|uniref:bacteriochlorophyll 4-vinyl reductase n=1 Tax=Tabrizicola sp. TaxID=2005166 RepID=UPI00273480AE|nr:bacteriochlorophyll 4-vinyl reductase [Tabrizicola sp.]MDP3265139.1 bacteriochlorophyll 4-vinyl reductase [Tabrizicola sp.]MDP3646907.1 bacteriochlorophyll 4-vinyl reductase [Paracoccaceae bacterium]MDZ4068240.1 bacteriochlorophyll 4-vinyl reductase [Tabrizicola sp.]
MDGGGFPVATTGRIGPNAILQLIRVLDQCEGRAVRDRVMAVAGVAVPPDAAGMWPEAECRSVHLAVHVVLPERAEGLLRLAGTATADYVLAHRIPQAAHLAIRALPGVLGARVLTAAIARNAWTFVGSGRFAVAGWRPLTFVVEGNPLDPGEGRACVWHAAVFERLFRRLVWPSAMVADKRDGRACRFTIRPTGV